MIFMTQILDFGLMLIGSLAKVFHNFFAHEWGNSIFLEQMLSKWYCDRSMLNIFHSMKIDFKTFEKNLKQKTPPPPPVSCEWNRFIGSFKRMNWNYHQYIKFPSH